MHPEIASIKARLTACGASQLRLAEVSGVSSGHLSMLFSGQRGEYYTRAHVIAKLKEAIVKVEKEPRDPAKRRYVRRSAGRAGPVGKKRALRAQKRRSKA